LESYFGTWRRLRGYHAPSYRLYRNFVQHAPEHGFVGGIESRREFVLRFRIEDPVGHTPEVSQFHLYSSVTDHKRRADLLALLKEGIMHLAILWYPASKLQQTTDLREFDYAIHPLFSPFFGFSHRRKRKIRISDSDLWTLIEDPATAIKKLLQDQNRLPQADLPDQLALFSEYYDQ